MISATRAAVEPRITSSGFIIRIGCFSIKFRPSSDKVVILTMTCWLRLKPPKSVVLSSTHGTHPLTHGRYGISPSHPWRRRWGSVNTTSPGDQRLSRSQRAKAAPRRAGGVWSVRVVQWEYHLQMGRDFPTSIFFEVVSIKRIWL